MSQIVDFDFVRKHAVHEMRTRSDQLRALVPGQAMVYYEKDVGDLAKYRNRLSATLQRLNAEVASSGRKYKTGAVCVEGQRGLAVWVSGPIAEGPETDRPT